jgi:hypothetical protein
MSAERASDAYGAAASRSSAATNSSLREIQGA